MLAIRRCGGAYRQVYSMFAPQREGVYCIPTIGKMPCHGLYPLKIARGISIIRASLPPLFKCYFSWIHWVNRTAESNELPIVLPGVVSQAHSLTAVVKPNLTSHPSLMHQGSHVHTHTRLEGGSQYTNLPRHHCTIASFSQSVTFLYRAIYHQGFRCINVQVVCDARGYITHVYCAHIPWLHTRFF